MDALVMTPASERWPELFFRLGEALIAADDDGHRLTPPGRCAHDHRYTRQVMTEMVGIDIDGSIAVFLKHGGYCDCEVMFNVAPDVDETNNKGQTIN